MRTLWCWLSVALIGTISYCPCDAQYQLPVPFIADDQKDLLSSSWTPKGDEHVPEHFVQTMISSAFDEYNKELETYNHLGALIAWNMSVNMNVLFIDENEKFLIRKNIWNNHWCAELMNLYHHSEYGHTAYPWDMTYLRELHLICQGPRFTSYQLSNVVSVLSSLQEMYNKQVCLASVGQCMRMEPDLNHFMETSRDEAQLREGWTQWHQSIGEQVKPLYGSLIRMLNQGARQAGYKDMGQCWREETEIGNLRELVSKLYGDVKYLYTLLHAFVRNKLEKHYGIKFPNGHIPAHLLGNMWAQKWDSLIDIMWNDDEPTRMKSVGLYNKEKMRSQPYSLTNKLLPHNATVTDMVKAAENFFVSMGFPHLPKTFWRHSYFEEGEKSKDGGRKANSRNCHGSAANMFHKSKDGDLDLRMMMCAQVNDEDLITIHHEVGHIMYFMAYSKQPTIFQDGANSAFHESVGDAVTYDLRQRRDEHDWMKSLLKTGLAKLPQVGFGLIMDTWRWKIFENPDKITHWNELWWELQENILGVTTPGPDYNRKVGLDATSKFHIIDNIPYVRYFLGSFLQLQFYEAMCTATHDWNGDLHKCQIKGSKSAGALLSNMMEKGSSRQWNEILYEMTGSKQINSQPFITYFKPLQGWLEQQIQGLNLTIGW